MFHFTIDGSKQPTYRRLLRLLVYGKLATAAHFSGHNLIKFLTKHSPCSHLHFGLPRVFAQVNFDLQVDKRVWQKPMNVLGADAARGIRKRLFGVGE